MNKKWQIFGVLATACLLFSASCSTTKMKTVWQDEDYRGGKIKKVFVIGVAENPMIRRVFEDKFAEHLKARGTDAISSYSLIPSKERIDRETVESKIKIVGADAVIVTRVSGRKKHREYSPSRLDYTRGVYRTYSEYYTNVESRRKSSYSEYEVVSLETRLYETSSGKMIWSGLTETRLDADPSNVVNEGTVVKTINKLIKTIVALLSDGQLI
jgi:hypothetical protein